MHAQAGSEQALAKVRVARHEERFTSLFTASELEFLLEALRKLRDVT